MNGGRQCACTRCVVLACALCIVCLPALVPNVAAATLDSAYETELTRLSAEKDALKKALRQTKSRGEKSRASLASEIESLAAELTRLRADNIRSEASVPQSERIFSMETQESSIDRRAIQIETWLETHGIQLPHGPGDDHASERHEHPPLQEMVDAALQHIESHGQLRVQEDQEYFGTDGVAMTGSVLYIAEVGAIALDEGNRPLELAPDGSLRMVDGFAPQAVSHGDSRTVGVILYDPDDIRALQVNPDGGWKEWLDRGGVVMWVIALLALLAVLLTLERLLAFSFYLVRLVRAERRGPSARISDDDKLLMPVALIQAGHKDLELLESAAAEAVLQVQTHLRRGVSLLAVVASVAPLLGLLGTVTGMIGTFGVITEHGTGDPRLLSGGISEALLTTQFGLMVAIPALLLQTTLYRSGDALIRRLERFALKALAARSHGPLDSEMPDNVIAVRSER